MWIWSLQGPKPAGYCFPIERRGTKASSSLDEEHEARIGTGRQLLNDIVEVSVPGMAPRDQRKRGQMNEERSFPGSELSTLDFRFLCLKEIVSEDNDKG